jgi:hypothetical protein
MNKHGHPPTLQASQPGNQHALRTGVYSPRALTPRAADIADAVLAASHTVPLDRLAAEELGRLLALIEAIDDDLAQRGLTNRSGNARTLLDLRLRASGRLERWCAQLGLTPAARASWVTALAHGESLAETLRRQRNEGDVRP